MKTSFFDIDGTLHKQDMLFEFILFLLKKQWWKSVLAIPLLFIGLIIWLSLPRVKLGVNLIYFVACFGLSQNSYQKALHQFGLYFRERYTPFSQVVAKLQEDGQIWLISGSLRELVEEIYPQLLLKSNVVCIASKSEAKYFSRWITQRCYGQQKVVMLDKYHSTSYFDEGYSDSLSDMPLFQRCKCCFLIGKNGEITEILQENIEK